MKEIQYLIRQGYYVKDYPYNTATNYPDSLVVIEPRYKKPVFTTRPPSQISSKEAAAAAYECDLCNTSFKTEDELSKHVRSQH